MSKLIKNMLIEELRTKYSDADSACVVDLTGVTVHKTEAIRTALREKQANMRVIKNSMARKAFAGTPLELLGETLEGPCALVTCEDSIIDVAKDLVKMAKDFNLGLKTAIMEGDPTVMTVVELSKLRSQAEVIGEVAMLLSSPGRSIAGCLQSPAGKIAGCLQAIADKDEAA